MRYNCKICGKFTKDSDLALLSDDYEQWSECKRCLSPNDYKRYFSRNILSEVEFAFVRLYERVGRDMLDASQHITYNKLVDKVKASQEEL